MHTLLYQSLAPFGTLGLGNKEVLWHTSHEACYEEWDSQDRLYRKVR